MLNSQIVRVEIPFNFVQISLSGRNRRHVIKRVYIQEKATFYAGNLCGVHTENGAIYLCLSESAKLKFKKYCATHGMTRTLVAKGKIFSFPLLNNSLTYNKSLIRSHVIIPIVLVKLLHGNKEASRNAVKSFYSSPDYTRNR